MKSSGFSPKISGIYRAPADIGLLRKAALEAGLSWIPVDLGKARGKRALLNAFARACGFPDTFGGNWDALADCLQDLSWLPEQGTVLLLSGTADFAAAAPDGHAMLLEILGATADYWRRQGRAFMVLVDISAGLPVFPVP